MNQDLRNIILIIILMLSALLVPVSMGASVIDSAEEDDPTNTAVEEGDSSLIMDFPMSWIRIPVHQMLVLCRLGMSIFTLFVVYLGGRSKHRRFNDRTLDRVINLFIVRDLGTALTLSSRAVFNFRFLNASLFGVVTGSSFYPISVFPERSKRLW
jgi:hypothetical protein